MTIKSRQRPLRVSWLHGFLGAPDSFEAVRRLLPSDWVHHTPWLPGHGPPAPRDSVSPGYRIDGSSFEDAIAPLTGALSDAAPDLLVGYSLGGRCALGALARGLSCPPPKVMLVGAHFGLVDPKKRAARKGWDEQQALQIEQLGVAAFVDQWAALPVFAGQRERLAPEVFAAQRVTRTQHHPAGLALAMRRLGLGVMPVYQPSPSWRLVVGEKDQKFRALYRERPQVEMVPQVGHNVVLEAPDTLAELVLQLVT